ncbi:MAG TPA: hypothetical protein VN554_02520 [Verrucomicrobiae bacterium]|nr:hypothetical protein [Verrucomicrobiae bacterium]
MPSYKYFPDGFAETMTRQEMGIIYDALDPQVHELVEELLDFDGDGFLATVTDLADTPELAVRALSLNVGRTLPQYGRTQGLRAPRQHIGETRVIEPADAFVVVGGPHTNHPNPSFTSILHRADSVETVDAHTRLRLSCNDFAGIAIAGVV